MFRAEVLDRAVKGIALVAHPVWMPLYINGLAWSAGLPALEAYPPQVLRWFTAALALMAVVSFRYQPSIWAPNPWFWSSVLKARDLAA